MRMMNEKIILLVGKSGSGKTTIAEYLENEYGLQNLKSYTTRNKRYQEENNHVFISYEEYLLLKDKIGVTNFNGHYYCSTRSQVDNADIYAVDPDGVYTLFKNYHGEKTPIVIYLDTNVFLRFYRMVKRGDSLYNAISRLHHDRKKFAGFKKEPFVTSIKNNVLNLPELATEILKIYNQ